MPQEISINQDIISDTSKPYLVAEIGLNHNRDMDLTKKIIISAKDSHANAVKFQTYITEKLVNINSSAFKLFKDLELNEKEFTEISNFCKSINVTFFSTPFSFESVDLLEKLEVPCYKIASMDTNYYEFLTYVGSTKKPVILSTGMSAINVIEKAIESINKSGNNKIILLHTISKYPPKYEEMDMRMIERLKVLFDYPVGFSDHTSDNNMAIIARTLGACLFEKHFTINKNLPGPDHSISLTPSDFIDLYSKLNMVDQSMTYHNSRTDIEIENGARRSLYAGKDLKKGEVITRDMIDVVRPYNNGLKPEDINLLIGKRLKKDVKKAEVLDLSCI
jgi:sialic acid synthase SpsE